MRELPARRIAIFLPTLGGGGAERVMVSLANAIVARGFAVDLVVANAEGSFLSHVSPGVHVVDFRVDRIYKALLPLARYLRSVRPIAMLAAIYHANVIALLARMLACVPTNVVVSVRSTISEDYRHAHGIAAKVSYALVARLYPFADGICTVSLAASRDLARFAGLPLDRVQTIYNPFDLPNIEVRASEKVPHPWLDAGQPPVVLAIGRLTHQKDFPTLIRAFAQLRKTHYSRLLILGEGELRPLLQGMVSDHGLTANDIQLPGFVGNPLAWLARSSVFVLSSLWEGLPGVLIEALACGAPVVSTDCPSGPNEILQGGRWGRLVPVGDVNALALAVALTLDTARDQLPNGRLRAADFAQEHAVDAYLNILGMPLHPAIGEMADTKKQQHT